MPGPAASPRNYGTEISDVDRISGDFRRTAYTEFGQRTNLGSSNYPKRKDDENLYFEAAKMGVTLCLLTERPDLFARMWIGEHLPEVETAIRHATDDLCARMKVIISTNGS